jgi:signal transduction histidine kinase
MADRLHSDVETALYRVVQEALTNMARHAVASRASVVLSTFKGYLTIVVEDDGCGFDPGQVESGRIGILGMRERVVQLGGTLEIESRPGAGTAVIARVPITR